ncbi:MAG: preprotein translocase subunit SecA, partial [Patescibacteria group bacterium]
ALSVLDFFWMNHLEDIEALVESVRLRAYGQKDPLVEYRRESKILFDTMTATFESWAFINVFKLEKLPQVETSTQAAQPKKVEFKDVGRNDPCPCGAKDQSGHPIKYKRCHGR